MSDFWTRLKKHWGVKNDRAAILILLGFGLTGSLSVKFINVVENWVGITAESPFWVKLLSFVILVLPVYNLLLIIIGSLLGQHAFFKKFIIKFFKRLLFLQKK